MRRFVLIVVAGCAEPTGLGAASASAYPDAASATVIVANATDGVERFRIWSVEIGEAPPGTDCKNRGDALIVFDVFTQLSSAPRGVIASTVDVPPMIYPAVYPRYANGFAVTGALVIDAASTTRMLGSFSGTASLDGTVVTVDASFDAPTCAL